MTRYRCPLQWQKLLIDACAKHSLSPSLLDALIWHESKWNPAAIGDHGLAKGLGQMHPTACEAIGANPALRGNVADDIEMTAAYLAAQFRYLDRTILGSSILSDPRMMIACMMYNRGPTDIIEGVSYADAVAAAQDCDV